MKAKLLLLSLACAISAHGQKAFVDGTLMTVCNSNTHTVTGSIGHAGNFDGMELSADGSKLMAYNETINRMYIINAATNALIDSFSFTKYIGNIVLGPGSTFYYSENPTNRIYKGDWATKALVDSSTVFTSGTAFMRNRPGTSDVWLAIDNKLYSFTHSSMALTSIPSRVSSSSYIANNSLVFNASGSTFYYMGSPNAGKGKLYKMDAATKAIQDSLQTSDWYGTVKNLTISNDTNMYITYFGAWPNEPSKIYRAKANSMNTGFTDSVNTPYKPFAMVEKPGSNELWVVYHYNKKIGILDKANNLSAIDSITVGSSPKDVVFSNLSVGISNTIALTSAVVYPNPGNGLYYINSKLHEAKYRVMDIAGRTVTTGSFEGNCKLDISNAQSGVYYLHIAADDNAQVVKLTKL